MMNKIFSFIILIILISNMVLAVTVVQQEQEKKSAIGGAWGMIGGIINFVKNNWKWFLVILIILILGIIVYYLLAKIEEERKERDDIVYDTYKKTRADCENSVFLYRKTPTSKKKIVKKYSLINLLWLGIPIVRNDYGTKVLNYRGEFLGWWRGDCNKQEGTLNILAYTQKWLIFFEKPFIIKVPIQMRVKEHMKDEKGNYMFGLDKKPLTTIKLKDYSKFYKEIPNGDIMISCTHIETIGYYKVPVFITNDNVIVDVRRELDDAIIQTTYDNMLTRVLSTGTQQVEKAMLHNPYLVFSQKTPEKTKDEMVQESGGG